MNFLLSICIPTYNRGDFLEKTLKSIVESPAFLNTDEVEIVVSDNGSSDLTPQLRTEYERKYPEKIRWFRQEPAIEGHDNFRFVLEHSSGMFRKLHNDNLPFTEDGLEESLSLLRKHQECQLALFMNHPFPEDTGIREEVFCTDSISRMVESVSGSLTWIGEFCIRKDAYEALAEPFRYAKYYFPHIDMILRTMHSGGRCVISGRKFFEPAPLIRNKYTHNHAEVFGQNFIMILKEYVSCGLLEEKVLEKEKKKMLFRHIIPYYFDFFRQYNATPQTRYWHFTRDYRKNLYYYASFLYIFFMYVSVRILHLNRIKNHLQMRLKKYQGGSHGS